MNILQRFNRTDKDGNSLLTPFVASWEKRILYFHIAKTGGSTIVHTLRDNGLDDGILSAKGGDISAKTQEFCRILEEWDSFFKFTFVRDKYDLLVSLWHYNRGHGKRSGRDFGAFVSDYVVPSKDEYDYWIDQYYLTQPDIFDAIGGFGNFDADFRKICGDIGIEYDGRKDNVGPYDHKVHYSTHYTEAIQQQVYNKFRQEIDYFGFENPVHQS
jgi:hypothetical protein